MTTDPPPAGSPWATHCPDAYPPEWFDALGLAALPPGFVRFATADECAVIAGAKPPRPRPRAKRAPPRGRGSKPPAAKPGDRFRSINAFIDVSARDVSSSASLVWVLIWRDTRVGTARTSQADIARRLGLSVKTVKRAMRELRDAGLLFVVSRGNLRSGPACYRLCPTAGACE